MDVIQVGGPNGGGAQFGVVQTPEGLKLQFQGGQACSCSKGCLCPGDIISPKKVASDIKGLIAQSRRLLK